MPDRSSKVNFGVSAFVFMTFYSFCTIVAMIEANMLRRFIVPFFVTALVLFVVQGLLILISGQTLSYTMNLALILISFVMFYLLYAYNIAARFGFLPTVEIFPGGIQGDVNILAFAVLMLLVGAGLGWYGTKHPDRLKRLLKGK